jgi:hypothetical protein
VTIAAVLCAVIAAFGLVAAEVVVRSVEAVRAQNAADAAALAAVELGTATAVSVAAANGALLESIEIVGFDALVVVRVGRSTATARATTAP